MSRELQCAGKERRFTITAAVLASSLDVLLKLLRGSVSHSSLTAKFNNSKSLQGLWGGRNEFTEHYDQRINI